jgi:hypothetical protein
MIQGLIVQLHKKTAGRGAESESEKSEDWYGFDAPGASPRRVGGI